MVDLKARLETLTENEVIARNIEGINFGGWTPNHHCKIKFGISVKDCHNMCMKYWQILI